MKKIVLFRYAFSFYAYEWNMSFPIIIPTRTHAPLDNDLKINE